MWVVSVKAIMEVTADLTGSLLGARNWAASLMWIDPVSPYMPCETDCSISRMGQLWLKKA